MDIKLKCYKTLHWKGSLGTNILAHSAHLKLWRKWGVENAAPDYFSEACYILINAVLGDLHRNDSIHIERERVNMPCLSIACTGSIYTGLTSPEG